MSSPPVLLQEERTWLENVFKKLVIEETVTKVLNIEKEDALPKGENYSSDVFRIKLDVALESGREITRSIIMKTVPESDQSAKAMKQLAIFKREVKVYKEILSKLEAIMNEFQDPNDKLWSRFLDYKPYSKILLEDLTVQNYKVANRRTCLDMKHGFLVMNSLGRFHGISHYLLYKGILKKEDLDRNFIESESPFTSRLVQGGLKQLSHVMEEHWPSEWKETAQKLAKETEVLYEKVRKIYSTQPEDCFLVMTHGDCWTSNLMFKYSPYEEDTPIAVKFLDFQGSNFNSYLIDVVYFLYISMCPEIRRTNTCQFLKEYYKSLEETLKFYGIPEQTPTMEHILQEFKRLKYLSCFYNLVMFAVGSADVEKALYFDKIASNCDSKDCYNPEIFKAEKYRLAIADDLKYWEKEGII